jgi:hypothetical protein
MKKLFFIFLALVIFAACSYGGTESEISEDYFRVTLIVSAETLLENMNLLDREKHELIPADGIIFPETEVVAYDGESVFDVLNREMRNAGIHLVFRQMPVYDSVYIEAVNNIFEFDAGSLSGWKYRINGEFPSFGASSHVLQPDDFIEWLYTLDLGRDLE